MDTLTICRLMCSDVLIKKSFGGVYPSDSLPEKKHNFSSFIVNLDESKLPGSHWIAIYFENKKRNAYYFDSYGQPPVNMNIVKFLKDNADFIYYNKFCFQDYFTTTCGHFCMYFLFQSVRRLKLNNLSKYNKKVNEKFIKNFVRQHFKLHKCCHYLHAKNQACIPWINMLSTHDRQQ